MEKPQHFYSVRDTLGAIALGGIVLVLMYLGRSVLSPILLAVFISAIAYPGFHWLRQKGAPPGVAVVGLIAITAVVILLLSALLGLGASRLLTGLQAYSPDWMNRFSELQATLASTPLSLVGLAALISPEAVLAVMATVLKAIIEIASTLLFSLVLVGFFLLEAPRFRQVVSSVPENLFVSATPQLIRTMIAYFGIRTFLNLITGLGFFVLLWVLGVDYAPLWGALAFILSYIPYIGLVTAMIPPILLGYAESGVGVALLVLIGAIVFNLTLENVLEPTLTGKRLRLSPAVVFVSFFVWAFILGPVGALLSMPIMVMLSLVLKRDAQFGWLGRIISPEDA